MDHQGTRLVPCDARRARVLLAAMGAGVALGGACVPFGDEPTTRAVVTPIATGLNNPTAVLIEPDGTWLVAESGAARIIRVDADGTATTVIDGFALGTYSPFNIGPLSLASGVDGSLVVGEGGNRSGRERVSFFSTDGQELAPALTPPRGSNFFDVALDPATGMLYIAGAGSDALYVAAPNESGGYEDATELVADTTADPIGAAAPAALALDGTGRLLVGFADDTGGKIVAIDPDPAATTPVRGTLASSTGAVTSIAIRPSDGAIVYAQLGPAGLGDLKSIDSNGVETTIIGGLAGPTDLAFGEDDTLYVTLLGDTPNADAGQLAAVTIVDLSTNGELDAIDDDESAQ